MFPNVSVNQHSRRDFLAQAGAGAGMLAYAALAAADGGRGIAATHFVPRASRVIWLFMHGGPIPSTRSIGAGDPRLSAAYCRVCRRHLRREIAARRQRQSSAVGVSDEHWQHFDGQSQRRNLTFIQSLNQHIWPNAIRTINSPLAFERTNSRFACSPKHRNLLI